MKLMTDEQMRDFRDEAQDFLTHKAHLRLQPLVEKIRSIAMWTGRNRFTGHVYALGRDHPLVKVIHPTVNGELYVWHKNVKCYLSLMQDGVLWLRDGDDN